MLPMRPGQAEHGNSAPGFYLTVATSINDNSVILAQSSDDHTPDYATRRITRSRLAALTFTFHVEGALVRTLVGKDLPGAYGLLAFGSS